MIAVIDELSYDDVDEHLILFRVVDLLQRVVPDDARRVLDDVIQYIYTSGLRLSVVNTEGDLQSRQYTQCRQSLVKRLLALGLEILREITKLLEKQHEIAPLAVGRVLVRQLPEQLGKELLVVLYQSHYLDLVEEDKATEGAEHVVLEHARRRQHNVLYVLDPIGLMDLGQQLGIRNGYGLLEFGQLLEVLAMLLWLGQRRLVLEAADDVEDRVVAEHHLEQGVLVEQKDVLEDVVQVVQALHVAKILAGVKEIE